MEKQKPLPSKPVLGKGLASLLPPMATPPPAPPVAAVNVATAEEPMKDRHPGISMASVDEITANEFQPRTTFNDGSIEELAQSIKANGLIQPLVVRKAVKGYQLIAGERRLRAARIAGLKYVPIVIKRTTDKESLELALIENIQREELNCVETAKAYAKLIHEFNYKQEELSARVGKDRSSVANHLRMLRLPADIQQALQAETLSFGHGKALASLESSEQIEKLGKECIEKKWSVRELENHIQMIKNLAEARNADKINQQLTPLELRLKNLGKEISAKLSTKVQLKGNESRGKIVIEYFSSDDLDRVLNQVLNR